MRDSDFRGSTDVLKNIFWQYKQSTKTEALNLIRNHYPTIWFIYWALII